MTDTGIFCSGAHVVRKAGAGANSTAIAEAYTNDFIAQAESYINTETRYNFSDNYASLNVDVKAILTQVASDLAAMYAIQYDMSGYSSRQEASTMLNLLWTRAQAGLSLLKEKSFSDYVRSA